MPKTKVHDIEVCRTGFAVRTIKVRAQSRPEAIAKALDKAGNEVFSEHASEYSVPGETTDKGEIILTEPLPLEVVHDLQRKNLQVSGAVAVQLAQMFGRSLDSFLDYIGERLTGANCLVNVDYTIVGYASDAIYIRVFGDGSSYLAAVETT